MPLKYPGCRSYWYNRAVPNYNIAHKKTGHHFCSENQSNIVYLSLMASHIIHKSYSSVSENLYLGCCVVCTKRQRGNTQKAKFMGPTWGPPGSCLPQMGPMLVPWTLLSGYVHKSCLAGFRHRWMVQSGVLCQKQVSRTGTSNYIPQMLWDVIICLCFDTCYWHNTPQIYIPWNIICFFVLFCFVVVIFVVI